MPTQKPLRELVPELIQYYKSHSEYLQYNNRLMLVYEGQLRKEIEDSLKAELGPASYEKAIKRVPSINLLVRIVDKLSRVYSEPALRTVESEDDTQLLEYYEKTVNVNDRMTSANKLVNLHKCAAIEPYISDGVPGLRVLPAHTFLVWSDSPTDPLKPTVFMKFMYKEFKTIQYTDKDGRKQKPEETIEVDVIYLYSDTEFLVVDSTGAIRPDKMTSNPEGVNPVGVIPMVYINRSDFRLLPCPDTDTLDNTVLIPKLLADLNYAVQFSSHSLITAIDLDLPPDPVYAPDSVWQLSSNSEEGKQGRLDTIKPTVDIEDVLMLIQSTLSMWLESRNIKAGALGEISAANAASGIAKIIDESDATQDRQAQCGKFTVAERDLWKLIKLMHKYWVDSKQLTEEPKLFSEDAEVNTQFPDQAPIQTEKDRIDEAKNLLDAGLINKRQAIKKVYPHLDEKALDTWVADLEGSPTFNGAQIEAMSNMLQAAALGQLPRDSAKGMLVEAFGLNPDKAEEILGSIGEVKIGTQDQQSQDPNGQASKGGDGPGSAGSSGTVDSGADTGADASGERSEDGGGKPKPTEAAK